MKHIPRATYRLQFNGDFTFQDAEDILDYLADLGISDVYASPLFEAGPQSTHGYDICSFGRINPRLGTTGDFDRLAGGLKQRGLGLLVDIVPNHMSATVSNDWWRDVLENGRDSTYAQFFDVNWEPSDVALRDKILLPVLEDSYEKISEKGKLRLVFQNGKFAVAYYERSFPVDRRTLPAGAAQEPAGVLKEFNDSNGRHGGSDRLDKLVHRQHYCLDYWKTASEKLNYRRFFDVTEMVAVRMELPEVFRAAHELVFGWLASGKVTGLRIDHPDGLWDPKQYLERLRERNSSTYIVVEKILSDGEQLPRDWPVEGTTGYDYLNRVNGLFVDGTNAGRFDEIYRDFTENGEEFGEIVYQSRKLVLESSFGSELKALTTRLKRLTEETGDEREYASSELRAGLEEVIACFPVYRTFVNQTCRKVSPQDSHVIRKAIGEAERRSGSRIDKAVFDLIKGILLLEPADDPHQPTVEGGLEFVMKFQQLTGPAMAKGMEDTAFYRFNRLVSLNEVGGDPGRFGITPSEFHQTNSEVAKNWPHTMLASATHDTKRGEDVRARLNVLSEMPDEWCDVVRCWSRLNAGSKTIIGEKPAPDANDEYLLCQTLIGAWQGDDVPGKDLGERVAAFMLKAVREAKVNTSWTEPNEAYEQALNQFVFRILEQPDDNAFFHDLRRFSRRIAFFGRINSLAQTLLKLASPGVPDCYQGSDLWDLNLVDPDNRRPVDFNLRRRVLADLKAKFENERKNTAELFAELLADSEPGAMKLFLIWRVLNFRKKHRDIFDFGDYLPLAVEGPKKQHVCAFVRQWEGRAVVAVVPRLVFGLTGGVEAQPVGRIWEETKLLLSPAFARRSLRNVITGEEIKASGKGAGSFLDMSEVFRLFPVALFECAQEHGGRSH